MTIKRIIKHIFLCGGDGSDVEEKRGCWGGSDRWAKVYMDKLRRREAESRASTDPSLRLSIGSCDILYITSRAGSRRPVPCIRPCASSLVESSFLCSLRQGEPSCMDGAGQAGLSSVVVRYFYLKQVTSYATASSMVLILYDFCECRSRFSFSLAFLQVVRHSVTTFSQEVSAQFGCWSAR